MLTQEARKMLEQKGAAFAQALLLHFAPFGSGRDQLVELEPGKLVSVADVADWIAEQERAAHALQKWGVRWAMFAFFAGLASVIATIYFGLKQH